MDETIDWSNWARSEINNIEGCRCLGPDRIGRNGTADFDPTRLTVNFGALGLSGVEAEDILKGLQDTSGNVRFI